MHKLEPLVYLSRSEIQIASSAMKMKSNGFCLVDMKLKGNKYKLTRLNLFENLCSDVIPELDFLSWHQHVIFEFNGESDDLVTSGKSTCAVTIALTDAVSLFSNLSTEEKPTVTKFYQFNQDDQKFIQQSFLPSCAQVVVVKDFFNWQQKCLCINYLQNINIYTQLNAYT